MSFGIRDTHDPVHDSVGGEDQIVDAEQDIANAQNNTPGLVEEPSSDEENDVLVPDFGDIVFAEELGTVSVSFNTVARIEQNTISNISFCSQTL